MTGVPHRPSSIDGHPSVSLLIAIALRRSTLAGYRRRMPVALARPIGYAYRLGRCGNWRSDVLLANPTIAQSRWENSSSRQQRGILPFPS